MDHVSFMPYHNRHIVFEYPDNTGFYETLSGVVLDLLEYNEKRTPTEYIFIPSNNLIEWQQADASNNETRKAELQRRIDIQFVHNARHLQ